MKLKLHWQILISITCALLLSIFIRSFDLREAFFGTAVIGVCNFVGTVFLNALKMIVVPLIVASIIGGMIGIGNEKSFGRMGLKTVAYYVGSTLIAVLVGLLVVNIMKPGHVDSATAEAMLAQARDPGQFEERLGKTGAEEVIQVFIRMIPSNIIDAAGDNSQILGIIFFSLLFGYFVTRLPEKQREFQVKLWQSLQDVTLNIADLILLFAPIGVFGLVTPKFIDFGFQLFLPIMKFTMTVLLGLGIHFFIVMSIFLFLAGIKPWLHFRAMAPALLTAYSTSSSISTLPITMECCEKTANVSNRVSSFTLPLGASINMNGTALYECVIVIFIAQFYQTLNPAFEFGITSQITVVLLALMTSFGVAGIPAASIVAIAIITGVVGLPFEYVGIVLVVDRILDMCRSVVNIFSDSVGAVVIGKSEGETEIYKKERPLSIHL